MNRFLRNHDSDEAMNSAVRDIRSGLWIRKSADDDSNDTTMSSVHTSTPTVTTTHGHASTTPSSEEHTDDTPLPQSEHVTHNFTSLGDLAQATTLHVVSRFAGSDEAEYARSQRTRAPLARHDDRQNNRDVHSTPARAIEEFAKRNAVAADPPPSFELAMSTAFPAREERVNRHHAGPVTRGDDQHCAISHSTTTTSKSGSISTKTSGGEHGEADSAARDACNSTVSTPMTAAASSTAQQPLALFHDPLWGSEDELDAICRTSAAPTAKPQTHMERGSDATTAQAAAPSATPQPRQQQTQQLSPIKLFSTANVKAQSGEAHPAEATSVSPQGHTDGRRAAGESGTAGVGANTAARTQVASTSDASAKPLTTVPAHQSCVSNGSQQTTPTLMSAMNHTAYYSPMLPHSVGSGAVPGAVAMTPYTNNNSGHFMYQYVNAQQQHQQQQHLHMQQQLIHQQQQQQKQLLLSAAPPMTGNPNSPPMYTSQPMQNSTFSCAAMTYPVQPTLYPAQPVQSPMFNAPTVMGMPGTIATASAPDPYSMTSLPVQYIAAQPMPLAGGVNAYPNAMMSYRPGDMQYYTVNSAVASMIPVNTVAYTS